MLWAGATPLELLQPLFIRIMPGGPKLSVYCRLQDPEKRSDEVVVERTMRDGKATGVAVSQPSGQSFLALSQPSQKAERRVPTYALETR